MSAEIINLRQARKARAKRTKETKAAENRAHFGTSRAQRERQQREQERAGHDLDQHRRAGADQPTASPSPPATPPGKEE